MPYREVQYGTPWLLLWAVVIGGAFLGVAFDAGGISRVFLKDSIELFVLGLVALIAVAIPLLFGRLITEVSDTEIQLRFGWTPFVKLQISRKTVTEVKSVQVNSFRNFGGWGIRYGKFEDQRTGCWNMRGNRGVLLELSQPRRIALFLVSRLFIGSQDPDKLKAALSARAHQS